MDNHSPLLKTVFDGWDGYHRSIVNAIAPRTREELLWRPAPDLRSVGELAAHIALGRLDWFQRMNAPGSAQLAEKIANGRGPGDAIRETDIAESASALVHWLEITWGMIEKTLSQWTVADLAKTYPHTYWGTTYAVSHQWTIWRIMTHDVHHGGQLSMMLYSQGIDIPELGDLGGHLTDPPLVEES